jgi:hypothetical protein
MCESDGCAPAMAARARFGRNPDGTSNGTGLRDGR